MDRTIAVVAFNIKYFLSEGRLTEKEADILATRMVDGWQVRNVPFDKELFYRECGLDLNNVPEED